MIWIVKNSFHYYTHKLAHKYLYMNCHLYCTYVWFAFLLAYSRTQATMYWHVLRQRFFDIDGIYTCTGVCLAHEEGAILEHDSRAL